MSGCTSEEDISDANRIAEIVSNTVSSALQSGDLVSSILRNPDLAGIIDCLVTWGGAYSASSASVQYQLTEVL